MEKELYNCYFIIFCTFLIYGQVFDFEGNKYDTIQLGKQVWLKQNIRSKKYYDGKILDSKNYKCPNGDCSKTDSFGLIYNFSGLTNGDNKKIINGICPLGYSIPTPQNWHELMLFLNADTNISLKDGIQLCQIQNY
ncbi:MAG: hypothetical protein IPO62_14860 [Saprospiraceae bacterium]|nr:hypothetical protein [Saprospiraceae bacterium]